MPHRPHRRRLPRVALAVGAAVTLAGCGTVAAADRPADSATEGAPVGPEGTVWVANEDGDSLTVIDAATSRVVTTISGVPGHTTCRPAPTGPRCGR